MRCIESSESFFGHHQHSPWLVSWQLRRCWRGRAPATPPSLGRLCGRRGAGRGLPERAWSSSTVWEGGSPLPKAPRAKPVAAGDLRGDFDGWGGVDEIDVIFLCAWLAAPVELPGSRTRVGRYRRRRRCTPNADDNLACVGMKIGFVAVSGFSERADSYYNGGGKSVKFRWPGDGCGEEGVSKGMEAFGRASDRLPAPRRRRSDPPIPVARRVLSRRPPRVAPAPVD